MGKKQKCSTFVDRLTEKFVVDTVALYVNSMFIQKTKTKTDGEKSK